MNVLWVLLAAARCRSVLSVWRTGVVPWKLLLVAMTTPTAARMTSPCAGSTLGCALRWGGMGWGGVGWDEMYRCGLGVGGLGWDGVGLWMLG